MDKTTFLIKKMDCRSEEQLIRMKLESMDFIKSLQFDLSKRVLNVFHVGELPLIVKAISSLNFGETVISTEKVNDLPIDTNTNTDSLERRSLYYILFINVFFFIFEMAAGIIAGSMGLIADSLDMLTDAIVYILSLMAVGGHVVRKQKIARLIGYFQILLAVTGIMEVMRRTFLENQIPDFKFMISISIFAMLGNIATILILNKTKDYGVHMKASMICTSNDVWVNMGVIVAGVLVYITGSKLPDLMVGAIVFLIVLNGARNILAISRK